MIRMLFVKWVIVSRTRYCSELSGVRKDIARDFKFINVGNRKIKHCYVHAHCYFAVVYPCFTIAASCRSRERII